METAKETVAIPSGRGIRSGTESGSKSGWKKKSQSPLVGAFVPAKEGRKEELLRWCRNPLWSGHSFRQIIMERSKVVAALVAIPSGRGIRSGDRKERYDDACVFVAIPSGRGIRSGIMLTWKMSTVHSRNPLWSGHSFRQRIKKI